MHLKKLLKAMITASVTLFMCTGVISSVYRTDVYAQETESMAYLEYDAKSGTYHMFRNNGAEIDSDYYMESNTSILNVAAEETTQPAVTTAVSSEAAVTGTTVKTGTIIITTSTTVTTKAPSPAGTVPDYSGRYRNDALAEWEEYLASYTTTTTTTTTTATKKVYDGIDVSRHQGIINWSKVKATGIDFVMIRAGYGKESDQVDANFHANIRAAQNVGIDCGVYWYSYALTTDDALQEAKLCYNTIKSYKLTCPVSFDIEDPTQKYLSKDQISAITKTFCDYLESKNYYVSVYSYASMLNDKMTDEVLTSYDIWVAHTGVSKPSFSGNYGMWQYSWTGRIDGISTDVDLDYAYKNYPQIIKDNNFSGN